MPETPLQEQFGQIDIYLFDQLLKGRILPGMRVLDAGCGSGRNLVDLLRERYEVNAVDPDAQAVQSVRALARRLAPALSEAAWRCHEQGGHPLPPVEARPQATSGSDPAKSGEPLCWGQSLGAGEESTGTRTGTGGMGLPKGTAPDQRQHIVQ
jgi:hypothetical protein